MCCRGRSDASQDDPQISTRDVKEHHFGPTSTLSDHEQSAAEDQKTTGELLKGTSAF